MKILIDMNLSPEWVGFLSSGGFEAIHWTSIGSADTPDTEIFEYASDNGFVLFTHDLDFGTLLSMRRTKSPSVIQVRMHDTMPLGPCGPLVLTCLRETRSWLDRGALVTVDFNRHRIRMLPIR